ncbi:MAG: hypothetical protein ACTSQY_01015 [Candidatus Odinarchaeia archaeon]
MAAPHELWLKKQTRFEKPDFEEIIIEMHDALMAEYGWIPFEEFFNLPFITVLNLAEKIEKRNKKMAKALKEINNKFKG